MKTTRVTISAGLVGLALLFNGCANYQVGSTLPAHLKTVYMPVVENRTAEPLLEVEVSRALLGALQQDGTLRLAENAESADAVLRVTVHQFRLTPIAFRRERTTQTTDYRLTLLASYVFTERATGKVISEYNGANGEVDIALSGDLFSTKQAAMPRAAEDLARDIVKRVVESW